MTLPKKTDKKRLFVKQFFGIFPDCIEKFFRGGFICGGKRIVNFEFGFGSGRTNTNESAVFQFVINRVRGRTVYFFRFTVGGFSFERRIISGRDDFYSAEFGYRGGLIKKHMWPVTVAFPKSIEGFILTFVDKYCALSESFEILKSRLFMKKAFRYAYLAFSLVIIKI